MNSLIWLWIFSSKSFLATFGQRLSAYSFRGVCCSSCVPNLAKSPFKTVTVGFPGSLIDEVVGPTLAMMRLGASISCRSSKFFLYLPFPGIFRANFNWTALSDNVNGNRDCWSVEIAVFNPRCSFYIFICLENHLNISFFHVNISALAIYPFILEY